MPKRSSATCNMCRDYGRFQEEARRRYAGRHEKRADCGEEKEKPLTEKAKETVGAR